MPAVLVHKNLLYLILNRFSQSMGTSENKIVFRNEIVKRFRGKHFHLKIYFENQFIGFCKIFP